MSLKFLCPLCSYEIITGYLRPGDMMRCPSCGNYFSVPPDSISTDERSNIIKYTPTPEDDPVRDEKQLPTLPPPEPTEWGGKDVLKYFLYYYICDIAIVMGLAIFCAIVIWVFGNSGPAWAFDWDEPYHSYFYLLAGLLIDVVAIWLIYNFVVKKHHNRFFEALRLTSITRKQFIKYMAVASVLSIISIALVLIVWFSPLRDNFKDLPQNDMFNNRIIFAILRTFGALVAPFTEEIVYRGFLFAGFKKSFGQLPAAIIVSILFIIGHGSRVIHNPFFLISLIMGSVTLIWIRIRTNSVTNTIAVHFSFNLLGSILKWVGYFLLYYNK
jgi:membrane protease YdiL (CAAX protease family)